MVFLGHGQQKNFFSQCCEDFHPNPRNSIIELLTWGKKPVK